METLQLRELLKRYQPKGQSGAQDFFKLEMVDGIAVVTFDTPNEKVNKWSSAAMVAFYEMMEKLQSEKPKAAVMLSSKASIYIAGADISEIRSITTEDVAFEKARIGQELFNHWERLPFPTVAAIHGATMGGGCEFVLSCTARICSDDRATQIGLPEVKLGVIPGWGGTQRLPRMIGLLPALDIILAGKTVDGRKAQKLGLVQDVCPKELLRQVGIDLAKKLAQKNFDKFSVQLPMSGKMMQNVFLRPVVFMKAKKELLRQTHGNYPAPVKALQVIQKTYGPGAPAVSGYDLEAKGFAECAITEVSKNLVQLFFLSEDTKKTQFPTKNPVKGRKIESIAVLGAGVMGAGIAQVTTGKGILTYLRDISESAVAAGIGTISKNLGKRVQRKSMTSREFDRQMALIHPVVDMHQLAKAEMIVEAIVENLEIKQKVFQELETVIAKDAILASNTSTLSVSSIGEKCSNPERIIGLHFFNPVDKMPLVEIIYTQKTKPEAVATALEYVKRIGKTPVVCKDGPGFIVNRILGPYLNEAGHLAVQGASLDQVDKAFLKFGMPMGPYRLMDEVGLDVAEKAGKILHRAFGDRMRPTEVAENLTKKKLLGKKSGQGFYLYSGKREVFNYDIYGHLGLSRPTSTGSTADEKKWLKRLLYPMINEAARVLEDGIAESASAVDVAMIFGTGFAPFRGGLLRWADTLGAGHVISELEEIGHELGAKERFAPSPFLLELAKKSKGFYS